MQLYELVADVARYPEFLPWCHAARIRRRESPTVDIAELAIGFGPFHETFVSRVERTPDDPGGPRIDTTGIEGPFRLLKSHWSEMSSCVLIRDLLGSSYGRPYGAAL